MNRPITPIIKSGSPARTQSGAAAVEFALVIILLLMIVAGVIEFGRAFWYYDALAKATRDGARLMSEAPSATINSGGLPAARSLVVAAANAARVSPVLVTANVQVSCLNAAYSPVACVDGTAPANVRVAITGYDVTIGGWIPFFLPTGGVTSFTPTLAPDTTMRYMP